MKKKSRTKGWKIVRDRDKEWECGAIEVFVYYLEIYTTGGHGQQAVEPSGVHNVWENSESPSFQSLRRRFPFVTSILAWRLNNSAREQAQGVPHHWTASLGSLLTPISLSLPFTLLSIVISPRLLHELAVLLPILVCLSSRYSAPSSRLHRSSRSVYQHGAPSVRHLRSFILFFPRSRKLFRRSWEFIVLMHLPNSKRECIIEHCSIMRIGERSRCCGQSTVVRSEV